MGTYEIKNGIECYGRWYELLQIKIEDIGRGIFNTLIKHDKTKQFWQDYNSILK